MHTMSSQSNQSRANALRCFWAASVALLVACGGGGGGSTAPPPDTSVTQTISAANGGTIDGPRGTMLKIPPGALATDTAITLSLDTSGAPTLPAALTASATLMLSLLPHGTSFGVPVTLSLPAVAGQQAFIAKTNEQRDGWQLLVTRQTGARVEAALTSFSYTAVLPCPGPPFTNPACGDPGQQGPPEIIGEPRDSLLIGEGFFWIFRVDAIGRAPLSYAWMKDGLTLPTETNQDILINPALFADNGRRYSVRVTDADGRSVTSRSAVLSVNAVAPLIVNDPADVQVTAGANAFFFAATTSSIAQTLQWKSCPPAATCPASPAAWLDVGAQAAQLTLPTVQVADSGTRVALCASNASGTSCSRTATLTVLPAPVQPVIVTPPQALTTAAGSSASFTVAATGGALAYEWQSGRGSNFAVEGRCGNSATCTLSNVLLADDGLQLRVRVSNSAGQALSDPAALLTVRLAAGVALARVSGTVSSSIALHGDGQLLEWGTGGGVRPNPTPFRHAVPIDVATIASGNTHSLAIRSNGEVVSWGNNTNGQLGNGTNGANRSNPLPVVGLAASSSIAAGIGVPRVQADDDSRYSLAVTASNGLVWAWGTNLSGQLGNGNTSEQLLPVPVGRISGVTGLAAGSGHVLARRSDGSVWAWGRNTSGQLGTGDRTASLRPLPIALTDIVAVAAGDEFSVALRSDGTVLTWGSPAFGKLGDGGIAFRSSPAPISLPAPAIGIAVGVHHVLALLLDGRVYAWGRNDVGQTGTGSVAAFITTPQRVVAPLPTNIVAIGAGVFHSLALDASGNVWGWGYNNTGQLFDGTTENRFTPVQVQGVNLN